MLFHALTRGEQTAFLAFAGLLEIGHVWRRRRRRGAHEHLHHPFATQHRRRAIRMRREREHAAVSENSHATRIGRILHFPEVGADHARDPVVLGEILVHERPVGRVQIEEAAILAHQLVEQHLRFVHHVGGQLFPEIRVLQGIRMHLFDVRQAQPLGGEARRQGNAALVGKHALGLRDEHRGVGQQATTAQRHQLRVGRRSPQEERQARRQVDTAHGHTRSRLGRDRHLFHAEDEVRARQQRFD